MSLIRVKVQINDSKSSNNSRNTPVLPLKFVYLLDLSSTKTVDDLRRLLEQYIIRQFTKPDVQIVQLMTGDGYYLPEDALCEHVLQDNEHILCVDMGTFVQENYPTLILENFWCEIKQHDASDDDEKYIQVGLNKAGKLFIRTRNAWNVIGLHLFNVFQLVKIASEKSKNNLIARINSKKGFIEVKWDYHPTSDNILYLICSLKIGSSKQIWSDKLQLSLDQSRMVIEKTAIEHLSGGEIDENSLTEEQVERLKELTANIPSAKHSGPDLDVNEHVDKTISKYESQGDSSIRLAYGSTNTVRTYQDIFASADGTFGQHFVITHINFSRNETDQTNSIDQFTLLYQGADQSWHECQDIAIAPIALRGQEPCWLADSIIRFDSEKLVSYAIRGSITIKGKPGDDNFRRRRAHRSLPQPLKLQINIKDNLNKQSSLIVEQLNEPLSIDTSQSFIKYNESKLQDLLAFVYADDLDKEERYFLAIYLDQENHIVINSNRSTSLTLQRKAMRTMEFNARQNNTVEEQLDSIHYKYDDRENKAVALFDSQTFLLYAIRLEVTARESTSEETVLLPLDKIQ